MIVVLAILATVVSDLDAIVDTKIVQKLADAVRKERRDCSEDDVACSALLANTHATIGLEKGAQIGGDDVPAGILHRSRNLHLQAAIEQSVAFDEGT